LDWGEKKLDIAFVVVFVFVFERDCVVTVRMR